MIEVKITGPTKESIIEEMKRFIGTSAEGFTRAVIEEKPKKQSEKPDINMVFKALRRVTSEVENGTQLAHDIVTDAGASKVKEIPEEKFDEVLRKCEELLA